MNCFKNAYWICCGKCLCIICLQNMLNSLIVISVFDDKLCNLSSFLFGLNALYFSSLSLFLDRDLNVLGIEVKY